VAPPVPPQRFDGGGKAAVSKTVILGSER